MIKKFYKRILNQRLHMRSLCNPFINLRISALGEFAGTNQPERDIPIIVSLFSSRKDFKELPQTLYSLLNQSLKPDKLILWLDEDKENLVNLPYELTPFVKNGLEIRFVKSLNSYTKIMYALKEFANCIIVTASDKVYYTSDWLKKLYISYIAHPEDIHVHNAQRVKLLGETILSVEQWDKCVIDKTSTFYNFPCNNGGILYPPKCFSKEVFREDILLNNAITSDELWMWFMALINNRKIRVVKNHIGSLIYTNIFKRLFSSSKQEKVDSQISILMKFYGQNVLSKLL